MNFHIEWGWKIILRAWRQQFQVATMFHKHIKQDRKLTPALYFSTVAGNSKCPEHKKIKSQMNTTYVRYGTVGMLVVTQKTLQNRT